MELLTMVSFVCRHQPRIQALDHVMWIIDAFADFSDKLALPVALETTNPRFFARAVHYIAESPRFDEQEKCSLLRPAMERAAVRGDIPAVELCKAIIPFRCDVALIAALRGDLTLLKWIWGSQPTVFHHENVWVEQVAFDAAAERGDLVTVQWLVAAFPNNTWSLGPAAIGGSLDVIAWLYQNANVSEGPILNVFTRSLSAALAVENWRDRIEKCCFNRQEPPLRWRYGIPIYFSVKAMDWAAQSGNLELLQWFNDNGREGCSVVAVMIAAEAGNMETLLWLHEHYNNLWTSRAMDLAAEQGHLDIVQWMHTNRTEGCSANAMNWAAKNRQLEMVEWLHNNRSEGCTTAAMNAAARNGHLDVVQWLHKFRTEGCTVMAMNKAAEDGNLEMVKWLHHNRTEGCTTSAVDLAAASGHLDVIKFLVENCTEGGTFDAYELAEEEGHIEILRWFDEHNPTFLES